MRTSGRLPADAGRWMLAAAMFAVLAVLWAAPSSLSPTDTVPDLGDPLHLGWVMAWDAHQLLRRPWALFDSNAFHPYPRSLAFSDHLLPEALVTAPVFLATGNAVLAFNVALVLALAASGLGMALLVRRLTGSWPAALLAGCAYAFNSFTLHERPRVHVVTLAFWPVGLLFLDRFARSGRAREAALFVAALALQGLSGSYYLAYTALVAPLWLATVWLARGRGPRRPELRALLLPGAAAVAVVAAVLWPYAAQVRAYGIEKEWAPGADLLSYLDPSRHNWLWRGVQPFAARAELPHFLGLAGATLTAVGAVLVLARQTPPAARIAGPLALATAAAGVVLSLGPVIYVGGTRVGPGPYRLVHDYLPLARAMASPERAGAMALFGSAVLVGLAVEALLRNRPASWRAALASAVGVVLLLEHWQRPRGEVVPAGTGLPSAYAWLAAEGRDPIVELPLYPDRARRLWAAYLHFSTRHWRPIPIGRASFYPPAHDYLAWGLRGFPDPVSLALLDRIAVRTLLVHPLVWTADERRARLAALDAEPRLHLRRRFDDVLPARFFALGLGEERVYALAPGAPQPPPCSPVDEVPRAGWSFDSTGIVKPERAVDGDRRTAWYTARPQRPGDRLDVELPRAERVSAVTLDLVYPYDDFARHLVVALSGEGEEWRRVAWADGPAERVATLGELLERPREARLVVRFAGQTVRRLRLTLGFRQEDPSWPRWAVPELRLYRECR